MALAILPKWLLGVIDKAFYTEVARKFLFVGGVIESV